MGARRARQRPGGAGRTGDGRHSRRVRPGPCRRRRWSMALSCAPAGGFTRARLRLSSRRWSGHLSAGGTRRRAADRLEQRLHRPFGLRAAMGAPPPAGLVDSPHAGRADSSCRADPCGRASTSPWPRRWSSAAGARPASPAQIRLALQQVWPRGAVRGVHGAGAAAEGGIAGRRSPRLEAPAIFVAST